METWEFDFEWLRVRHLVKELFKRQDLPNLNAVLFLIGVQELGRWSTQFTKEEKQDLMHLGVCRLLSQDGYYAFKGRDHDGWPHYELLQKIPVSGVEAQEQLLKEKAIQYFKEMDVLTNEEE